MLKAGRVATRLPAQDLERARAFYADKLGLEPVEEREGGLRYVGAAGEFALFESAGAASGDHTQMGWEVEDIEATVTDLRSRGVVFEEYDTPGLQTVEGIADIEGNYPSKAPESAAHGSATAYQAATASRAKRKRRYDRPVGASGPWHRGLYPLIGSSRPPVADVCG